jgi:hypothetical protein
MKILVSAALAALALSGPAAAQDAASDHWDARITAVAGKVSVRPADGSSEVAAQAGMPLEEGDRVLVPGRASAELSLDGGSLIALRENSDFKLEKTAKAESSFFLSFGSLLAKIQKLGSQSLRVRTTTSVASVRGTEFGVDAEDARSGVGVFSEGRVEVSGGSGMVVLTPNQETSANKGQPPLKAAPLNRFAGQRERMTALIDRLAAVRAAWKPLTRIERAALRKRAATGLRLNERSLKKGRNDRERERERKKP